MARSRGNTAEYGSRTQEEEHNEAEQNQPEKDRETAKGEKQASHEERTNAQESHNSDDRKSTQHGGGDDKQTDHKSSHNERDVTASQFRYDQPGVEPTADYSTSVLAQIEIMGEHKRTASGQEEWAAAAKSFESGELVSSDNKGRGMFGLAKSIQRKYLEHVIEAHSDISKFLEWTPKSRADSSKAVADQALSKYIQTSEQDEAQAAMKPRGGQSQASDGSISGQAPASDIGSSGHTQEADIGRVNYLKYMSEAEKGTMRDLYDKTVDCVARAADPNDAYNHKQAAFDISKTIELAARYLQKIDVIDADGNVTDHALQRHENRLLTAELNDTRIERDQYRDELETLRTATYERSGLVEGDDPNLDYRLQLDPTAEHSTNQAPNSFSKNSAFAYESGYTGVNDLMTNDTYDDKAKEVYSNQILAMMAGHDKENEPNTEQGTKFREAVDNSMYGAYEADFERLTALKLDPENTTQAQLEYAAMKEEMASTGTFFRQMQDQEYLKHAIEGDQTTSEQITMITGDASLTFTKIEDAGISKTLEHMAAQATSYASNDTESDLQAAANLINTIDQVITKYGNDSATTEWQDIINEATTRTNGEEAVREAANKRQQQETEA